MNELYMKIDELKLVERAVCFDIGSYSDAFHEPQ